MRDAIEAVLEDLNFLSRMFAEKGSPCKELGVPVLEAERGKREFLGDGARHLT
jgi:hypothetical protein